MVHLTLKNVWQNRQCSSWKQADFSFPEADSLLIMRWISWPCLSTRSNAVTGGTWFRNNFILKLEKTVSLSTSARRKTASGRMQLVFLDPVKQLVVFLEADSLFSILPINWFSNSVGLTSSLYFLTSEWSYSKIRQNISNIKDDLLDFCSRVLMNGKHHLPLSSWPPIRNQMRLRGEYF